MVQARRCLEHCLSAPRPLPQKLTKPDDYVVCIQSQKGVLSFKIVQASTAPRLCRNVPLPHSLLQQGQPGRATQPSGLQGLATLLTPALPPPPPHLPPCPAQAIAACPTHSPCQVAFPYMS